MHSFICCKSSLCFLVPVLTTFLSSSIHHVFSVNHFNSFQARRNLVTLVCDYGILKPASSIILAGATSPNRSSRSDATRPTGCQASTPSQEVTAVCTAVYCPLCCAVHQQRSANPIFRIIGFCPSSWIYHVQNRYKERYVVWL